MSILRSVSAIGLTVLVFVGCSPRSPVSRTLSSIVDSAAPHAAPTSLPAATLRNFRWFTEPPRTPLHAVWGADANHVWAVGISGTILMWNGAQWAPQASGTNLSLYGLWGRDEGAVNLLVFGASGALLH